MESENDVDQLEQDVFDSLEDFACNCETTLIKIDEMTERFLSKVEKPSQKSSSKASSISAKSPSLTQPAFPPYPHQDSDLHLHEIHSPQSASSQQLQSSLALSNERVNSLEEQMKSLTSAVTTFVQTSSSNKGRGIEMPKVELPKFSGKTSEFQPFWDKFRQAVHCNESLSGAQKLTYLQGCLTDEAKMLVGGKPTTDANYAVVVDTLILAFGDKGIAKDSISNRLYALPEVLEGDGRKLKRFYFEVHGILEQLQNLGGDADSGHIIAIIMPKLPYSVIYNMERAKGVHTDWTTALFKEKMFEEATLLETA